MKRVAVVFCFLLSILEATAHASQYIYRDTFENGYDNWSWASVNCNSTSYVYEGSKACRVYYSAAWQGFFAGHYMPTNTAGFDAVTFAIVAEGSPVYAGNIVLKFKDENQNDLGSGISLYAYVPYNASQGGPYLNPGAWRVVSVPLTWLSAMNRDIGGLMIMSSVGNTTIHVDNIKLTHTGVGVQGTFYSDGPGLAVVNESWTTINDAYYAAPPLSSPIYIHQGSQAFNAYFLNQYEGVKFRSLGGVNTGDKEYLTFWVNSPNSGNLQNLQVQLKGLYNTDLGSVPLSWYLSSPPSNQWIPITIPLLDFFGQNQWQPVESVVFINNIYNVGMVFFDDVAIAAKVFQFPVTAGKSWQLTTSPGDQGCTASNPKEPSHTDNASASPPYYNYHSIDINDVSAVGIPETDVPVFAVGGGIVTAATFGSGSPGNGYYVVVNHGDGYESRYLHLKYPPMVSTNQQVYPGQPLGILGATGTDKTHLHLGFRYNGSGAETTSQVDLIRMEGLTIKSYLTECWPGTTGPGYASKYYPSSPYW